MTDEQKQKLADKLYEYKWKGLSLDDLFKEIDEITSFSNSNQLLDPSIPRPTFTSDVSFGNRVYSAISEFKLFSDLNDMKKGDLIGIAEYSESKLHYKIHEVYSEPKLLNTGISQNDISVVFCTPGQNQSTQLSATGQNNFLLTGGYLFLPSNHYFYEADFNTKNYRVYRLVWSVKP